MPVLALALSLTSNLDDAQVRRNIAVRFLKSAGHSNLSTTAKIHTVETAPKGEKYQYTHFENNEATLGVEHFTNSVSHYFDSRGDVYTHRGAPRVKTVQEAIQIALLWCKQTGVKLPARFAGTSPALPKAEVARVQGGFTTEYSVEFRDVVKGYPAPGGNFAVIQVGAFVGRVTNFSGKSGVTYNSPITLIGKARAVDTAKAEFVKSAGSYKLKPTEIPKFEVNRFGFHTSSTRGADPLFRNLFFDRKARLSYNVLGTFPGKGWPRQCSLLIDAETGKLLSEIAYWK
ncbi:MAG: hypothetical protein ABL962_12200 [Fimbriimonadaceae bacterium]